MSQPLLRRRWFSAAATTAWALVLVGSVTAWPSAVFGDPSPPDPSTLTLNWSVSHPASSPPALSNATAAYDSDDPPSIVVFGGRQTDGTLSGATWVWNGSTWTGYTDSQPPARELASMAFDPSLHQLILFGGRDSHGDFLGDTWAWNGRTWKQLSPAGSTPSPRAGASLAYDPAGRLVLFGGTGSTPAAPAASPNAGPNSGSDTTTSAGAASTNPTNAAAAPTTLSDTWQWDGTTWVQGPAAGPPARTDSQMSYDSTAGATVLFSGQTNPAGSGTPALASDTWSWNGSTWAPQASAQTPPARSGGVFSDVPAIGGPLLVSGAGANGALQDGWVWTAHGWAPIQSAGHPSPRGDASGAFDAATSTLVLFGGLDQAGSAVADTDLITASVPTVTVPGTQAPSPSTTAVPSVAQPVPPAPTTTVKSVPPAVVVPSAPTTAPPAPAGPGAMSLAASLHMVRQGASVQLSGSGFEPGSVVTITFHSAPELIGHSVADRDGAFTATVAVPRSASPGEHHFVAQGVAPSGGTTELIAAVLVLGPIGSHGPSGVQTAIMVALSFLIPGAAWTAMSGSSWWRRRKASITDAPS
ncbi:MAG: hypothetical protein JO337_03390 [Acidimicrobiales bacterium]|nr:hypothetical protein [Acidimicrobiales bacterium]